MNIKSICISLENLKLIYHILHKNIRKINEFDKDAVILLENILKSVYETSTFSNIFQPNELTYKYICIDSNNGLTSAEFKEAFHYILFQYIETDKLTGKEIKLGEWQYCLVNALLHTNLAAYCQKIRGVGSIENKNDILYELFSQIYKSTKEFILFAKNERYVKVIAYFLTRYFSNGGGEGILSQLESLKIQYLEDIKQIIVQ